jgi:hypothetical protein
MKEKLEALESTCKDMHSHLDEAIKAEEDPATTKAIEYQVANRRVREVALKSGSTAGFLEMRKHPHAAGSPQQIEEETNVVNTLIDKVAAEKNLSPTEIIAFLHCFPQTGGPA